MEITLVGHDCFRLKGRDVTVVTDPFDGANAPSLDADIVTLSHVGTDHTSLNKITGSYRTVDGPGEYEIKGVLITGVGTFHDGASGKERGRNTVYLMQIDDLRVCHVGHLGHVLSTDQVDEIGTVDVLMVPTGSPETLTSAQATEVISQLEPAIVVPMDWGTESDADATPALQKFCHEMGIKEIEIQPKLNVNKGSLPGETQVVVLGARRLAGVGN